MDLLKEHNDKFRFFAEITGLAMKVHNKYHPGRLESAYEAALKYLLETDGHKVEQQVSLPLYWDEVKLDQTYRIDLLVDENIICELKSVGHTTEEHVRQLWSYMCITHKPYGMLINFGSERLYSAWYYQDADGYIEKVKLF